MDITRAMTHGNFEAGLLLNLLWIVAVTFVVSIMSVNLMKRRLIL